MQYCLHGDSDEQHGYHTSHIAHVCQVAIKNRSRRWTHTSHTFLFKHIFMEKELNYVGSRKNIFINN